MELIRLTADGSEASETSRAVVYTDVDKLVGPEARTASEALAVEEPLEIRLRYGPAHARATKSISVTMRTPGYDHELAAGFLMTEGVVRDVLDIEKITYAAEELDGAANDDHSGPWPTRR